MSAEREIGLLAGYLAQKVNIVALTPSIDAAILAAGEVIADTEVLANAVRAIDVPCYLQSLTIIDESDSGAALDVYLLSANVVMGAESGLPSISDANAANVLGFIPVATTDYKDVGGAKVAFLKNLNIPVKPALGTRDLYVAIVNGAGTPTFAAATALKLRFGLEW